MRILGGILPVIRFYRCAALVDHDDDPNLAMPEDSMGLDQEDKTLLWNQLARENNFKGYYVHGIAVAWLGKMAFLPWPRRVFHVSELLW